MTAVARAWLAIALALTTAGHYGYLPGWTFALGLLLAAVLILVAPRAVSYGHHLERDRDRA